MAANVQNFHVKPERDASGKAKGRKK